MYSRLLAALPVIASVLLFAASFAQAQKGIDTQTQKIKEDSNKTTTRQTGEAARSFDWGKGKTPVRERLPNPYKVSARRDVLVQTIINALKEKKMIVDEASSRLQDGVIITQPFTFARGSVVTQTEIHRYGVVDYE